MRKIILTCIAGILMAAVPSRADIAPLQVNIATRFISTSDSDLDGLGFEFELRQAAGYLNEKPSLSRLGRWEHSLSANVNSLSETSSMGLIASLEALNELSVLNRPAVIGVGVSAFVTRIAGYDDTVRIQDPIYWDRYTTSTIEIDPVVVVGAGPRLDVRVRVLPKIPVIGSLFAAVPLNGEGETELIIMIGAQIISSDE